MTIATYSITTATGNAYVSTGNTAITSLMMCNWGGSDVTANLYIVPNTFTADTTNIALSNITIPAGDTAQLYTFSEKLLLGNNDSIQIDVSANSVTAITSYTSL